MPRANKPESTVPYKLLMIKNDSIALTGSKIDETKKFFLNLKPDRSK